LPWQSGLSWSRLTDRQARDSRVLGVQELIVVGLDLGGANVFGSCKVNGVSSFQREPRNHCRADQGPGRVDDQLMNFDKSDYGCICPKPGDPFFLFGIELPGRALELKTPPRSLKSPR